MSEVVRLPRTFRDRMEFWHAPRSGGDDWRFSFEYVHAEGRCFIGSWADVAVAFSVAIAFRNAGVRIVAIEGGEP